jgi:hypothetical protein
MKIDPARSVAWLDDLIARQANPRHRAMAENYRAHLSSEVGGDLDAIMATLVDEPVYHAYTADSPWGDGGPKNRAEVIAFYQRMFQTRMNVLERHFDHYVISDDCLVADGWIEHVYPGALLATRGDADPGAWYLAKYRICSVLPYVGERTDVRMAGEDTYTLGFPPISDMQKLTPDELPDLLTAER